MKDEIRIELEALITEREGMVAENKFAIDVGRGIPYGEQIFNHAVSMEYGVIQYLGLKLIFVQIVTRNLILKIQIIDSGNKMIQDEEDWQEIRITRIDKINIKIETRKKDRTRGGLGEWHGCKIINEDQYPWAFMGYYFMMDRHGSNDIGESIIIRKNLDF